MKRLLKWIWVPIILSAVACAYVWYSFSVQLHSVRMEIEETTTQLFLVEQAMQQNEMDLTVTEQSKERLDQDIAQLEKDIQQNETLLKQYNHDYGEIPDNMSLEAREYDG